MPTFRQGFPLPFDELRDELDRFWNTLTAPPARQGWGTRPAEGSFPAVNVGESDEAVTVEAELPGLDAGDVEITVHGEDLVLKGSRPADPAHASPADAEPGQRVTWHRRERGTGSFERRISLPATVDASRVEARLVNGVLTVTCPKAAGSMPRKVEVRTT